MTTKQRKLTATLAAVVACLWMVYLLGSSSYRPRMRDYGQAGVVVFFIILLPMALSIWWQGPSLLRRVSAWLASVATSFVVFFGIALLAEPLTRDLRALGGYLNLLMSGFILAACIGPAVAVAVLANRTFEPASEVTEGSTAKSSEDTDFRPMI